jgi:hypothetical protein
MIKHPSNRYERLLLKDKFDDFPKHTRRIRRRSEATEKDSHELVEE